MSVFPEHVQTLISELRVERSMVVREVTPLPGVLNNNQLYRLVMDDGSSFVAKFYFQDERKRREREYPFLSFLAQHGFRNVPHPLYESLSLDCGVYEWKEGERKAAKEYTEADMRDLAEFIARIHALPVSEGAHLLDAHMAAFSMKDLRANIEKRLNWMYEDLTKKVFHPEVTRFLEKHQCLERVNEALRQMEVTYGNDIFSTVFPENHKRISSVDFGPHNTLFQIDGRPTYLDFENAGMDHPLRTIVDVVNHQKTEEISDELKRIFVDHYRAKANLPEEIWYWFEPMRRCGLIEWHLLHLNHLRPVKINQFKFSYAHGAFHEEEFIQGKLALAERTLYAMSEARNWFT